MYHITFLEGLSIMIELIGYHGTFEECSTKILDDGFTHSERKDHWLGQGIYFFDDSDFATWWAFAKKRKKKKRFV